MPKLILNIPASLDLSEHGGLKYRIRIIGEDREYFRFVAEETIPAQPGNRHLLPAGQSARAVKSMVQV